MRERDGVPVVLRSLVLFSWAAFAAAVGAIGVAFMADLVWGSRAWPLADAFVEHFTARGSWIPYLYIAWVLPAASRRAAVARAATVRLAKVMLVLAIVIASVGIALGEWRVALEWPAGPLLLLWSWVVPLVWLLLLAGRSVREWVPCAGGEESRHQVGFENG